MTAGSLTPTRRTLLIALVLAGTTLVACTPTPLPAPGATPSAYVTPPARITPGAVCLPRPPRTAAELQAVFSTRGPRWAGSDGALQTVLPDGRSLWSFGDTFVGQVAANGALGIAEDPGIVSNTFLVQSGACFTPLIGGAPGHPQAVFTPADPTTIFWPLDGYFDPVRNQVVVDSLEVTRGTFTVVAIDELTFSWPDLAPVGSARLPFPITATQPAYGETTLVEAGEVYLYSRLGEEPYVARAPVGHAVDGPWEYWTGTSWSATAADAGPMDFVGQTALAPLDVVKYKGHFVGVAKIWDVASDDVSQWTAPTPTGPWTYTGRLATTPTDDGTFSYGGRVVMLPGHRPVVIYSVNTWSIDPIRANVLRYGVRVVPYTAPISASSIPAGRPGMQPQPAPAGAPVVVAGHSSLSP
jgi:hypothetical protein